MNENVWSFFVPGVAVPQGSKTAFISKSTGRPIVVDKDRRLPEWRSKVTNAALARMEGSDFPLPFTGAVAISITFILERPKNHYGTGKNANSIKSSAPDWPARMPDIDKLLRAMFDALTDAQVWRDDSQVVWVQAAKRYRDKSPLRGPGVHITIAEAA